jgi:GT2 family glycosyltransferase
MLPAVVTLSVVVPATDGPATLDRCRGALALADDEPDEIIVVDGPSVLSAAAARNAGARRAAGDVIVFVDADVEVHRDAFTLIRGAFGADPDLAAVYGSYDDSPGVRTTVSAFRNLLHHHVHHEGAGTAETFWAGLGAVRRAAFLDVGGFDERRYPHPSIEDIELGHRLVDAGARIRLDPRIQGTHLKAWTLRSMVWTDFARRGIPWVALQLRERRASSTLNLGWRHRLCAAACVLAVLLTILGEPLVITAAVATLIALNRTFYLLLARRQGPLRAVVGVGLHAVHYLTAAAAVPVGIVSALGAQIGAAFSRGRAPAVEASVVE